MTFKLHIPGRDTLEPAPVANLANPLIEGAKVVGLPATASGAISALAELAALAICECECEAFEERAAIMEFDGGLSRADAEVAARACCDCEHFGRHRTCMEPVAAGLTANHEIVWPELGYAQAWTAFERRTRS